MAAAAAAAAGSSPSSSSSTAAAGAKKKSVADQDAVDHAEPPEDAEDNAPLFYSPGKRGFYSPIQGREPVLTYVRTLRLQGQVGVGITSCFCLALAFEVSVACRRAV